jgi:hypothetical protein
MCGLERECHRNVIVLDLLDRSLEELFNACGRRFSLKTILMLADQMIGRIEYLHTKNCMLFELYFYSVCFSHSS